MVKKIILFFVLSSLDCSFYAQESESISEEHLITFIGSEPIFQGNLKEFVDKNIIYPDSTCLDLLKGRVIVEFWIDTLGYTINHKIIRGIRKDMDEEALRVARLIKFDKPAYQKDKPIKVKFTLPVEFKQDSIYSREHYSN